jgi:pilus assembly protein CpaE
MIATKQIKALSAFAANERGTSAIEFAFCAPILVVGLLIVTDIGLAVNERMLLDQATRAGAELAMNSVDDTDTLESMVVSSATGAYGDELDDVDDSDIPDVEVMQFCECPDAPGTAVTCDNLCTGDIVPSTYFSFLTSKDYNGIFVPTFELSTELTVQTR